MEGAIAIANALLSNQSLTALALAVSKLSEFLLTIINWKKQQHTEIGSFGAEAFGKALAVNHSIILLNLAVSFIWSKYIFTLCIYLNTAPYQGGRIGGDGFIDLFQGLKDNQTVQKLLIGVGCVFQEEFTILKLTGEI